MYVTNIHPSGGWWWPYIPNDERERRIHDDTYYTYYYISPLIWRKVRTEIYLDI